MPKGPSLDPADKRMAVHVEDHPIDYGRFEGTIPKGQYGAGKVIVWDSGTWEPVGDARAGYRAGKLKFRLHGEKLHGGWTLVRMHGRAGERQEPWLLIKERDDAARPASEYSVVDAEPASVLSDMTIETKPTAAPKEAVADDAKRTARTGATKRAAPTNAAKRKAPAKAALETAARSTRAAPGEAAQTAAPAKSRAAAKRSKAVKGSNEATVEGVRISHPDRVVDASTGITKLDVVNYYLDASRLILPHLVERPVSLVRAPGRLAGQLVFQRHAGSAAHPGAARARPEDLARPGADGRGRLVHRADRRGAGQRDRVPHLERDDPRHGAPRPASSSTSIPAKASPGARCRKAPS